MIPHHINWKEKATKQEGVINLQLRVRWYGGRNECAFALGVPVEKAKYSAETCRVKNNTTHGADKTPAMAINKRMEQFEGFVEQIFNVGGELTQEACKQQFQVLTGKRSSVCKESVSTLYDRFMGETGKLSSWSDGTYTKFYTIKNYIFALNDDKGIGDIDEMFMYNIQKYLVETKHSKNSYICKIFDTVRIFLKWLEHKGYKLPAEVRYYSPKLRGARDCTKQLVYLTWEELMTVYDYKCKTEDMEHTKDCFCFCCFTGLRYSDMAALRKSDIYGDKIHVVTQKTTDALTIELNNRSRAILEKYKDMDLPNNKALPSVCNVVMNRNLKRLMKEIGVNTPMRVVSFSGTNRIEEVKEKWELIGTHTGRHTFVVNALFLSIPAEVIMRWTGHKDYEAMRPYIAIVDKLKENEMQKFNI